MITWKKIYATISVIFFVALITLFFVKYNEESYNGVCVKFCNTNRNEISDDNLRKKFYESKIHDEHSYYNHDDYEDFTMIRKDINCENVPETFSSDSLRSVR
jgi:hypothetical protein